VETWCIIIRMKMLNVQFSMINVQCQAVLTLRRFPSLEGRN